MTWDELVFRPIDSDPFIYQGQAEKEWERRQRETEELKPLVRMMQERGRDGRIGTELSSGIGGSLSWTDPDNPSVILTPRRDGPPLIDDTENTGGFKEIQIPFVEPSLRNPPKSQELGDLESRRTTLSKKCKGTSVDLLLDEPRRLMIWPPTVCTRMWADNESRYQDVVNFLRRLKEYCFTHLTSWYDINHVKAAIDAGWELNEITLNIECCYICDTPLFEGWLPSEGHHQWKALQICEYFELYKSANILYNRNPLIFHDIYNHPTAISWFYQLMHQRGFGDITPDNIDKFISDIESGKITCPECKNPYFKSLETFLKEAKTYAYNKRHGTNKVVSCNGRPDCDEMTIEDYRSEPGFNEYYQDEPGVHRDSRCGGERDKCNMDDLTRFKVYAQNLDLFYNDSSQYPGVGLSEMTPLVIGDSFSYRPGFSESEGGTESYINIGDGFAWTDYSEIPWYSLGFRADDQRDDWKKFFENIIELAINDPNNKDRVNRLENIVLSDPDARALLDWYRDSFINPYEKLPQQASWINRYEHSYPWISATSDANQTYGSTESEYLDLFKFALGKHFHSLAYYAYEFKGPFTVDAVSICERNYFQSETTYIKCVCDAFFEHLDKVFLPAAIESKWVLA